MTHTANDRQVGGDHYGKKDYQHWDFVTDVGMSYVPGCATKYVARWRDKNGVQDLEKALHYVDKARERDGEVKTYLLPSERECVNRFVAQLPAAEATIVRLIAEDDFDSAHVVLSELISDLARESSTPAPQG